MVNAPEEETSQQSEVVEIPKSGGGGLKWVVIAVVLVALLGVGGAGAWFLFLRGAAEPELVTSKKGQQRVTLARPIVPLDTFIVNLADPKGKRYLKLKLEVELSTKASEKELKQRMPQIRDQIIMALSSKTYQQIRGVPGKNVLRDELIARTNAILKTGKVNKVYFTDFVVQ